MLASIVSVKRNVPIESLGIVTDHVIIAVILWWARVFLVLMNHWLRSADSIIEWALFARIVVLF